MNESSACNTFRRLTGLIACLVSLVSWSVAANNKVPVTLGLCADFLQGGDFSDVFSMSTSLNGTSLTKTFPPGGQEYFRLETSVMVTLGQEFTYSAHLEEHNGEGLDVEFIFDYPNCYQIWSKVGGRWLRGEIPSFPSSYVLKLTGPAVNIASQSCCESASKSAMPTLTADNVSTASASISVDQGVQVSWAFEGDSLGCTIAAIPGNERCAIITAGRQNGNVTVKAIADGCYYFGELALVCGDKNTPSDDGPSCGWCESSMGGGTAANNGSPSVAVSLGLGEYGDGAGKLRFGGHDLSDNVADVSNLKIPVGRPGIQVLHGQFGGNVSLQIKTAQGLVDVVEISDGFDLKFYYADDVGSWDVDAGRYDVSGATAFATWTMVNPGGDTSLLDVTETRDGSSRVYHYTWNTSVSPNRWELTDGDGVRSEWRLV